MRRRCSEHLLDDRPTAKGVGGLGKVAEPRAAGDREEPASGSWSPTIISKSVVLPDPFGPTSASRSRAPMRSSAPRKRRRTPNPWSRPVIEIMAPTGYRPETAVTPEKRSAAVPNHVRLSRSVQRVARLSLLTARTCRTALTSFSGSNGFER